MEQIVNKIYAFTSSGSVGNIAAILLAAFSGGLFAGLWSNYFESKRRLNELRRDKYNDHKNTLVQIEHELIPVRINLSRNINSLSTSLDATNDVNIRVILRPYRLFLSPGLSMKILNVDLINDYSELFVTIESINSDIQYLEGIADNIRDDFKQEKVDSSLIGMYPVLANQLYKSCQKADEKSLDLLSKCKFVMTKNDKTIKKKYIKNGGEISYIFSKKKIRNLSQKTIKQETRPYKKGEEKEQFVAPYIDLRKVLVKR